MKRFSKSQRKHIRLEKAKIRRSFSDKNEQKKMIEDMYKNFINIKTAPKSEIPVVKIVPEKKKEKALEKTK